ncbi:MAG: hypothetical protein K8S99_14165 [Planctomycetes bacterium]|nr:hypothetical protein [Planctomycetota bacterium]
MLNIGWGSRSIVPDRPAMIQGQMHVRIAKDAMDPIVVTAMAIEGARPDGTKDYALIATLDAPFTTDAMHEGVRDRVTAKFPAIPREKIFLSSTHTHDSMVVMDGFYPHPGGDVMTADECMGFVIERTAEAVIDAWQSRAPARVNHAYGHAVVAHNRRPVYADGAALMYGQAARKDFRHIEGPEDHSLDMLFVWDAADKLVGVLVDVPCPSQVDEGISQWSADFWHEIRVELRKRLGEKLAVMPLCGAAGDQSPHFIFDSKQEAEMRKRRGVTERQEIAQRVADAVERALACTKPIKEETPLAHEVRRVKLSPRRITKQERDWHEAEHAKTVGRMDPRLWWPTRLQEVVDIFDGKKTSAPVAAELHFLRIGDAVIATNPFELYTDYGFQIKARSRAAQTFIAQITAGIGWYLPTARGVQGGGYGSIPVVSIVGPEGGQELVEHTVEAIASLFPETAKA